MVAAIWDWINSAMAIPASLKHAHRRADSSTLPTILSMIRGSDINERLRLRHFCSDLAVTDDLSRVDSTGLASRETCSMRSGIMLRFLILQFARSDYVKMPARLLV